MATPFAVVVGPVSESAMTGRLCEAQGQALAEAWRRFQHPARLPQRMALAPAVSARQVDPMMASRCE